MKLFLHLFSYLLVGIIILVGIDEYLSFRAEVEQYETDMITSAVQNGKSISGMITHIWSEGGESKALELIQDASQSGQFVIRWVWPQLLLNQSEFTPVEKEHLQKVLSGEIVSFKMKHNSDLLRRYTYVPVDVGPQQRGALELSQTLVPLQNYSRAMLSRAFTITALLALICGLTLYFFINWKIRMPLSQLMAQAKRIGHGDFSANHNIQGNDELTELAHTMNDMCSRLIIAKEKIKFEYDTRLKTLEQLRHTERLSSFGVISAGIAHELGTPLNVVDGRAKMIINEELQADEIKDCAQIIKNQAERMTGIVRQLLDFTRRPKQHISKDNLALLIKQVFQLLYPMAVKQHVNFSLIQEEGTEVIFRADFSQLQQVIVNLLMNSIQAMPKGGKVEVGLSNTMLTSSPHEDHSTKKYIKVRIHDEGEGIQEEDLEHILTPFFTTKAVGSGTGLGLSIAHGIVEEHGGWIDIESRVQNGACFSVYLPMQELKK
jgi:two-component system, NtrC family, sensor kinase